MKFLRTFLIAAAVILGLNSIEVNAQESGGQDLIVRQTIEREVFKQILRLPYYGLFDNIAYKVEGSTVTLYGDVVRPTTKSSAANVVKRIDGVSDVVNNIEVLPLSNFDDRIRYQVARTLTSRGGSLYRYLQGENPSLKIIVKNGNVTLEGFVANRGDSNLANILTNGVFGVFSVQNNLIVEGKVG